MTAVITLAGRRQPLTVDDQDQVRAIVTAVAAGSGEQFEVRRPSPDQRQRMVAFTADTVTAIDARGIDLTGYPSPVSPAAEAAEVAG